METSQLTFLGVGIARAGEAAEARDDESEEEEEAGRTETGQVRETPCRPRSWANFSLP
jgi:hypothetical protein